MADDLGTIGPVWPVRERDLIDVMKERLRAKQASGELDRLNKGMQKRAQTYARSPRNLGLPRASQARTFLFDPSVEVPYALRGANGEVIQRAGTKVNPLNLIRLSKRLVFVDLSDELQGRWLKRELARPGAVKLILTGGSVEDADKQFRERVQHVYFDQQAALTELIGVTSVPAVVTQERNLLRVQEAVP